MRRRRARGRGSAGRGATSAAGFFNSRSQDPCARCSRATRTTALTRAFWARRMPLRMGLPQDRHGRGGFQRCCRIIFGEADGFPGLTVDRFENVLVTQVLCLGMDRIKRDDFPRCSSRHYARTGSVIAAFTSATTSPIRAKEGMEQGKGWYPLPGMSPSPSVHERTSRENGICYTRGL